jgi:FkbM family methyltransferase
VAIDIGAHTGDSTMPMALAVGPRGAVFALEPNPYVFKVLALNATLNPRTTRIVPLMFAAMPTDGEFEFEYSDKGYCNGGFHQSISRWKHGHFSKLRVQGRNLADYLRANAPDDLSRLRFIKIDTEGFDRSVAATLRDLLERSRWPSVRATSTTFAGCATSCTNAARSSTVARFCARLPTCPGGGTSTCSRCRRSSHKDV